MIRDAETDPDDRTADICIIGAGAAGITLALELQGQGLEVLLLESGGEDREDDTQALYEGSLSGDHALALDACRLRWLGGSTNAWAGWCRRLEPEDFEVRDWMPESGWPIDVGDLDEAYMRAHELVAIGANDFDAEAIAARSELTTLELDPERVTTSMYQYSAPVRFGSRYRDDLQISQDVTLLLHANAVDMRLDEQGVSVLECATLGGERFEVRAGRFVLAAGGIENARLLLACNREIPEGIGNQHDHVGRWFMEHPHFYKAGWIVIPRERDLSLYANFNDGLTVDDSNPEGVWGRVRGALSLPASVRQAHGLPSAAGTLARRAAEEVLEVTGEVNGVEASRMLRTEGPFDLYGLDMRCEQRPIATSRVQLSQALDTFARPRADVSWNVDPADIAAMHTSLVKIGTELARAGVGRLWIPTRDGRFIPPRYSEGCHHMGTTRMAERAEDGVVDANCRVFGTDNLYVAGSSVFPTGGFANPTLTLVALAVRLARHLVEETP